MRILVTGAKGFAGRHLCPHLAEAGHKVYGAINPAHAQLAEKAAAQCQYFPCDVTDFGSVQKALRHARPDWVIHLAAISYSPEAARDPDHAWRVNLGGTLNLYEAVRVSRRRPRILFVGSSEEYGAPPSERLPIDESCPLAPVNLYGSSKAAADIASLFYVERHGLDIVRVRAFNHTGPGQSPRFVCSDFARQVASAALRPKTRQPILAGNLEARRDFSDVRDVIRAYVLALERCPKGEVYNIASGKAVRIGDMLSKLIVLSGVQIKIKQDSRRFRPLDAPVVVGDSTKFRRATGWQPRIPFDKTLQDLLEYWRANLEPMA